jgi:glycosyltransferase involved in cell wall biosynthesis
VTDQGSTAGHDIAVIVPCHNAAPFLEQMLESLVAQELQPAIVVIVDDGSTDGSADVVARWSERGGLPIRLVREAHHGVAAALRTAIAHCDQDLIARVDADDIVEPQWLGRLCAALDADPSAGYAYPAMTMFGESTGRYYVRDFDGASLLFEGNFVCCGSLMRRAAYEQCDGISDLPAWEDWDLWLQFLERGFEGSFVDSELYRWRRHGETRNRQSFLQRRLLRLRIWWRHRRLVVRYARQAPRMIRRRWKRPVTEQ